jgi:hypothetical protein
MINADSAARSTSSACRIRLPAGASPLERFWVKVQKTEGCWVWIGAKTRDGYGLFGTPGHNLAHRFSFATFVGEPMRGLEVCHSCDTPSCVRPDHLFLGTHDDNMKDAARKGRIRPPNGEDHPWAVLTLEQVREIRRRYVRGVTRQIDLAAEYGVKQTVISDVVRGETYRENHTPAGSAASTNRRP